MIDGQKVYFGTVDNIFKAAVLYDIVSIQSKGLKAKTNFFYSRNELIALMSLESLMHIKRVIQQRKDIKKQRNAKWIQRALSLNKNIVIWKSISNMKNI